METAVFSFILTNDTIQGMKRASFNPLRLLSPLKQDKPASQPASETDLPPPLALLRRWQAARLAQTHADLLTNPRFAPACRFFLNDIYAPRDFSRRDHDIEHLYQTLEGIMPPRMRQVLEEVVELNALTTTLDAALVTVLMNELGITDTLTAADYTRAYRLCDNFAVRTRQIDLLIAVGYGVDRLVRFPFIRTALRLAHTPAHLAGWGDVQDFFEGGFAAFKQMKGAADFLGIVEERERQFLDEIFAGSENPFGFEPEINM